MSKYMGQIMAECGCQHQACEMRGYCMAARIEQLAATNEELEAKLSKSEALLAKAVITMKLLVDVSVMMQSATSHNKHRHNTVITDTMWAQWSKQLKYTRTTLVELKGQDDD